MHLSTQAVRLPVHTEPPRPDAPSNGCGGVPYDALVAAVRDEAVARVLGAAGMPDLAALPTAWTATTAWQMRTLLTVHDGKRLVGAGLEVHRPGAQYAKLAGWWHEGDSAGAIATALVAATTDLARADRAASVTLEVHPQDAVLWKAGRAAGLDPVHPPAFGGPPSYDPASVPRGLRTWLRPSERRPMPYMRQTTEYTCGPVAISMALAAAGHMAPPSRSDELALWREATYVLGCEPFGLAVAAAARGGAPEVWTTTTEPILLEDATDPGTREMRAFVQRDFRARAAAAGVPVRLGWAEVAHVAERVRGGDLVLLLIDQYPMHLEPCPHWVVAHGVWGRPGEDGLEGGLIVSDPWTDAVLGESWLDAMELPLSARMVDRLWRWGSPEERSALAVH